MPVPVPAATPAPRRLLRDVVFDKMLAAIGDGTLELGERLNDDELVTWLGVSRTPVREAIAKLADFGLVDIEANRYTRVINPTLSEAADTVTSALGIWSLVARRAVEVMTPADKTEVLAAVDKIITVFDKRNDDFGLQFLNLSAALVTASHSHSLARMEETIASRAGLILRRASEAYTWDSGKNVAEGIRKAVEKGDPQAAFAAFDIGSDYLPGWIDRVRALDLFTDDAR